MKLNQLYEDKSDMPGKVTKPDDTKKKKTLKGPHGGGNEYHQTKLDNEFDKIKPITGHTQKLNMDKLEKSTSK